MKTGLCTCISIRMYLNSDNVFLMWKSTHAARYLESHNKSTEECMEVGFLFYLPHSLSKKPKLLRFI